VYASKNSDQIESLSPDVLLIEEAGEIFEAHTFAAMSPTCKQIIAIGDHMQLRPKAECYDLKKESGRGFNVDESLFERLILSGVPLVTLSVQHRMRPEFSRIIRETMYPHLEDAPGVMTRSDIQGAEKNLIFLDHRHAECSSTKSSIFDNHTRVNEYEAKMAIAIAMHFLRQARTDEVSYDQASITILTPYLGQLREIKSRLQAEGLRAEVNDRDHGQLMREFGDDAAQSSITSRRNLANIRVATVDNFQGEQADIIIISLVRSNPTGDIGFLAFKERVNVMLSRARFAQVILGDLQTFTKARSSQGRDLWKKIQQLLEDGSQVLQYFPVKCARHGEVRKIRSTEDFAQLCPFGGCNGDCSHEFPCGHICTRKCHPVEDHSSGCTVLCQDKCPNGHSLMKECGRSPPPCLHTISWRCPLNHQLSGQCFQGKPFSKCAGCDKIKLEEKANLEHEALLQSKLDQKHKQLEDCRAKLQHAKREESHKEQLKLIEDELALAEQKLHRSLLHVENADSNMQQSCSSSLDSNMRKLLSSNYPELINAANLKRCYKLAFDVDLVDDVLRDLGSDFIDGPKQKFKVRAVVEALTCCDIEMVDHPAGPQHPKTMMVRLLEAPDLQITEVTPATEASLLDRTNAPSVAKSATEPSAALLPPVVPPPLPPGTILGLQAHWSTTSPALSVRPPIPAPATQEKESETVAVASAPRILKRLGPRLPSAVSIPSVVSIADCDEAMHSVLLQYTKHGALAADNLLDVFDQEDMGLSEGLQALQFIIRKELDPHGEITPPVIAAQSQTPLCRAICSWATALARMPLFPLQAREEALKLVEFHSANQPNIFPAKWVEHARGLVLVSVDSTASATARTCGNAAATSDDWQAIEEKDSKAPAVMRDSILAMVGLQEVKGSLLRVYHRIRLSQEQDDGAAASYNTRFEGNPGTGKTTIARHYGTFLQQLSVLPSKSIFKETSGAKLIQDGVKGVQDILKEIKNAGGGVIFVDEAYQLASDREGGKVLDFILPLAESLESEFGPLVWVFAGYKKQMEKLFEHNDGLPSRFPHRFVFEDYSDDELKSIFTDMLKYKSAQVQTGKPAGPAAPTTRSQRSRYAGGGYSIPQSGQRQVDRFSRSWTYVAPDPTGQSIQLPGWTDKFGNVTVDPSRVGIAGCEVVDSDGGKWIESGGAWTSSAGKVQSHYPGDSPTPVTRHARRDPFHCEPSSLLIAIRRLGRCRGSQGFGNARAVRVLFEKVRDRQASRIASERVRQMRPDVFFLSRTDLLGPDVTRSSLQTSSAWIELNEKEGLLPVKDSVSQLLQLVLNNTKREQKDLPLYEVVLNRLFLGNPGTGKTTVAKLYGKILVDLGLLSKGEVIVKCASDFVGDVLGSSEKTTRSILQAAEGNVLVIDEAYSLYSGGKGPTGSNDPYKTAVIDTIVEQVQATPGADIAVVLLGYQAEMESMMTKVNPGLSRRFQIENAFHFPDFDDEALIRITVAKARQQQVTLDFAVAKRAVRALAKARAKPNFGNAGAVDNMLSKAVSRMQVRAGAAGCLSVDDFEYSGDGPDSESLGTLFDGLIGCNEVKRKMLELQSTVEFSLAQGKEATDSASFNYLFLGSPGTGKTTVARRMGKMFHLLGLLPTDELHEIKASELLTGYVGQAGSQTRELLRRSRGGVLFIDEAYQLDPARGGAFMTEAVDGLVGALTEVEFKGKLLVILAGYDQDMERMLASNPGLKSRFAERVHFHNFDANSTARLLMAQLEEREIPLDSAADPECLSKLAQQLVDSDGFGNGRDVVTWAERAYKEVAQGYSNQARPSGHARRPLKLMTPLSNVEAALKHMLASREVRSGGPECRALPSTAAQTQNQHSVAPAPPPVQIEQKTQYDEKDDGLDDESETGAPEVQSAFSAIDGRVLLALQGLIDENDLDSKEGAARLASLDPTSPEFDQLVRKMQEELGMSPDGARDQLVKWQAAQKNLQEMLQEQAQARVKPIWRCSVCGAANMPWIVCWVAPYIVGYTTVGGES
jgi:AAA+ superfamily predicted ATPase